MDLRKFGNRTGLEVPRVSIGGMRLPRDVDEGVAVIRHAIDSGMRYIDTSRGYGESEFVIGLALQDGYRQRVLLSTKCSPWIQKIQGGDAPTADCVRHRIEESMRRLRVDYLDFYQVWNIDNREHYDQAVARGGMVEGILKAKAEGLVRHTGFTTHEDVPALLTYIQEADWCEVMLMTYNLLTRKYAPTIEAAHKKGIGTIVMNPVGGGKLAENSPVLSELAREVGAASVADMAVRYALANPNIDTILCGIGKTADVDDTLASAARPLSAEPLARIDACLAAHAPENTGFCTGCKYCMPCPKGIDIPSMMNLVSDDRVWGLKQAAQRHYRWIRPKADACTACGQCEAKCTQKIKISEQMAYAAKEYAQKDA